MIYEDLQKEIKKFQIDLNDSLIQKINDHYKNEHLISKKDLASAIRLFITQVLFLEEEKEDKIKSNCNNCVIYLNSKDLWNKEIYEHEKFNENINGLKSFNVQLNQILSLYEVLGKDIDENYFDDVKVFIDKEGTKNNEIGKDNLNILNEENNKENMEDANNNDNDDEDDDDIFAKKEDEDSDDSDNRD